MLTEYVALGDWRLLFVTRDQLHTVTTDDVRRVMHTYFVSNNRTTGVYIPGQQSTQVSLVPMTQQEIDAMVSTAHPEQTTQGAFFDPSIENIAKVQQLSDIGTAKVSFIPRQTRGDTVSVAIDLSWGTERSLFGKEMVGSFAGIMLEKMAGALNEQEIQDKLLKLRAQVTLGGGASGARITIDAHKDTLPEVIALVGTIVKRPGVPTALLERERATFIAGLHDEQHDTQAIAGRLLARHINTFPKGDVRAATTVEEDIAAASHVTAADIAAFWKRFYSAQHAFIAVVGSFDQVATTTALTDAFGSWGSSEPYIRLTAGPLVTTTVNETVVVPDKADAFILGYEPLQIRDDDAAYPALTLANFMFGGGFMNSRVMTRIRQKDGLSYGAGTSLTADSFEQYGSFTFNATAAPQNIPKVEAAFKEELASVISKGFTDDEVTLAKQGMLETLKQDRMDAPTLAQQYVGLLYVGRTIAFEKTYEDAIERLTTAEVNEAVKKYWTVDGMSFFKAGTFKEEAGN
jgi:zinc protease